MTTTSLIVLTAAIGSLLAVVYDAIKIAGPAGLRAGRVWAKAIPGLLATAAISIALALAISRVLLLPLLAENGPTSNVALALPVVALTAMLVPQLRKVKKPLIRALVQRRALRVARVVQSIDEWTLGYFAKIAAREERLVVAELLKSPAHRRAVEQLYSYYSRSDFEISLGGPHEVQVKLLLLLRRFGIRNLRRLLDGVASGSLVLFREDRQEISKQTVGLRRHGDAFLGQQIG